MPYTKYRCPKTITISSYFSNLPSLSIPLGFLLLESVVLPLLVTCHAPFTAISITIGMRTFCRWSISTEFVITIITFALCIHWSIWVDTVVSKLLWILGFFTDFLRFWRNLLLNLLELWTFYFIRFWVSLSFINHIGSWFQFYFYILFLYYIFYFYNIASVFWKILILTIGDFNRFLLSCWNWSWNQVFLDIFLYN